MNIAIINRARVTGPAPRGEQIWSATTNTSFVVPDEVTSITAVVVGGGERKSSFSGAKGGNLRYIKILSVTPGESLSIVVGNGTTIGGSTSSIYRGGTALLTNTSTITSNISGGNGGAGGSQGPGLSTAYGTIYNGGGGGGAGGYSGNGGNGAYRYGGVAGTGGAGGGGGASNISATGPIGTAPQDFYYARSGASGGGVGLFGEGASGAGGAAGSTTTYGGDGGSGGVDANNAGTSIQPGGLHGGGGGGGWNYTYNLGATNPGSNAPGVTGTGGVGAVRIVWGPGREFPSTDVALTV